MNPLLVVIMVTAAFLCGCATSIYRERPPAAGTAPPSLNLEQIKEMTARGVSDETILSALQATRAVYQLTSKDVTELQEAQVSPVVIDYLLSTPQLNRTRQVRRYYHYYPPYPYWWHDWHTHFDFHHNSHHRHHGHH